jgi:hypothetical protein
VNLHRSLHLPSEQYDVHHLYPQAIVPLLSGLVMSSVFPKSVATWLQQRSDQMSLLLIRVRLLSQITNLIKAHLPEPLSKHCYAVNIDGSTLVVGCDSSTWATKLRFQLPHILSLLKDHRELPDFCQIRVRVQPLDKERIPPSNRRLSMSQLASTSINNLADNTSHPQLKAALRRLSLQAKSARKY